MSMLDSLLGAILLFLGFQTPPMVKGETTTASMSATTATNSANASASGKLSQAQVKAKERSQALEKRRESVMAQKDAFLKNLELKRQSAVKTQTEKKEKFLSKLESVKDDGKRVIIERVEGNLTTVNTNRMTALATQLTTMNAVLARISEKGMTTEADTTKLVSLVADAEKKIGEAQAAVETQAAKTYSISISSGDKNLKADATAIRIALSDDLKTVQSRVKAAREAVRTAVKELGNVFGETI